MLTPLLDFRSRPMSSSIFGRHTQASDVQERVARGGALQQHETIKGAVKWHVFCGDDPAGPIFKDDKLVMDYEERHLRNDNTKPGAVTAPDPACPLQRKLVMDAVAKSCTSRTALRNGSSASSPDQIMHDGEGDKFSADCRLQIPAIPPDSYKHEIHSSGFEPIWSQGMAF